MRVHERKLNRMQIDGRRESRWGATVLHRTQYTAS